MTTCSTPTLPLPDITMADAEKVSAMMSDMPAEERLSPADIYEIFNDNVWCCTNVDIENGIRKGVERLQKHMDDELIHINREMKRMRRQADNLRHLLKAKLDTYKPLRQRLAIKRIKEVTKAAIADSPAKKMPKTVPKTPRKRAPKKQTIVPAVQEPVQEPVSAQPLPPTAEEDDSPCPCIRNPMYWCTCPFKMGQLKDIEDTMRCQYGMDGYTISQGPPPTEEEYEPDLDLLSACSQTMDFESLGPCSQKRL